MRNKKLTKLALPRETIRRLTRDELHQLAGGATPSRGGSECESVMLCPTMFCSTKIFC